MKKIIIIGGTGFLGYHLAKLYLKKKWTVISISRSKPKKIRYLKKVKYILTDILNKKKLYKNLKKHFDTTYVVNFGGEVQHGKIKKTFLTHYVGSKNLASIFLNKPIKKFIQIGSSLEYGNQRSPQKESLKSKPNSNYSKAKAYASRNLMNLFTKQKFPVVIIRPYQIYGPNQDINRLIPIVIHNCLKNNKFPCSNGKQSRDFLYISDFIKFLDRVIKLKKIEGNIFNIGFGEPQNIKKVIIKIKKLINLGEPEFGKIKLRKEENLVTYPSISKAKKIIGWRPKINFSKGIKNTIRYYKNNKL